MSKLRPELTTTTGPTLGYESAYFRVLQAVARRRALIHGRLHNGSGRSCAVGCAFDEGVPSLPNKVIDEVAAYNDSFPELSYHERWRKVHAWLCFKTDMMRGKKPK